MRQFIALLFLFLSFLTSTVSAETIIARDAWIREAPPVSRVLAGYVELINNGDKNVQLVSVTSKHFNKVELHQTILKNGVSKMQQQQSIDIPAGSSIELKPEGMHMMLFNPVSPLKAGHHVQLELYFNSKKKQVVEFSVRKVTGGTDHSHHHMHH